LTNAAKEYLANRGYDPVYGARPLKRTIQKEIVDPLAVRILNGDFVPGDTVTVDVQSGEIAFVKKKLQKAEEKRTTASRN
jgi:ATP-dependent Clp protease ATP-binding subunit ClpB